MDQSGFEASPKQGAVLSVIVPVYNEKYTVAQVLHDVMAAPLPGSVLREVIVVDDGSTDGTWDVLQQCAREMPTIKVLRHDRNLGKGAAIRTALPHVSGKYVIIQDADLEYSPDEYTKLLGPVLKGAADVVYGSRFLASGGRRVLLFWHTLGNKLLTTFSKYIREFESDRYEHRLQTHAGLRAEKHSPPLQRLRHRSRTHNETGEAGYAFF